MASEVPPIVQELQKVTRLAWSRKQDDEWNRLSLFVYQSQTLREVEEAAHQAAVLNKLPVEFIDYAVTRWYSQKTHDLAVDLFCQHPQVKRWPNPHDHDIDFELNSVPFDLKLTHVSAARAKQFSPDSIKTRPDNYIAWLYGEQSRQDRFGLNNRLFVVCYDVARPDDSWKLKHDWRRLSGAIDAYLRHPTYHAVVLGGRTRVTSDVILVKS